MGNHPLEKPPNETDISVNTTSSEGQSKDDSVRLPSLHGNLMRERTHRDPYGIYEITEVLGEGSMGNVARVRKKDSHIGGSARDENVQCCCFRLCPSLSNISAFHQIEDDEDRSLPARRALKHQPSSMVSHNKKGEMVYALKSIHLERCGNETFRRELENEVEVLKNLDHPNVVRCLETYSYHNRLFILLEECSGGDLYTRDPYTEVEAQSMVKEMLEAVAYLHSRGVVHRDLKYENIMFVHPKSDSIKIIDFGLSQKFADNEHLHDTVGTVYTMAPELIRGDYDAKADIWSVGVIAYMLLASSMPFFGKSRQSVVHKILRGQFSFHGRRWRKVSESAHDFVKRLLQTNVKRRPSASEVLDGRDGWLYHDVGQSLARDSEAAAIAKREQMDSIQASMESFAKYSQLKKLALMVLAYKSTSREIGFLRKVFDYFDSGHDGEISLDEFSAALKAHYAYTDEEIERLFRGLDIDGEGSLQYSEFLAATLEAHGSIDEERLAEAFDRIDCDDSGEISVSNLQALLGSDISRRYMEGIIDEVDITGNHRISYDEFLALWDARDDAKLADIQEMVRSKRLSHDSRSPMSRLLSSFSSETSASGEWESGRPITGSTTFGRQKAQSIRTAQV